MRIDIIHYGEDYAKIEMQDTFSSKAYEYEVPLEAVKTVRMYLTAMKRLVTSNATSVISVRGKTYARK